MKILFISQHYRPEPCDTRTSKLAAEFAARGHESVALTSFPNYPYGKVYEGYRQSIRSREEVEGVQVVRVPMYPDHSRSAKKRALSYLSFGASAFFLGAIFTKRPDLVWIHHPPLTTGIAGYLLAKLKGVPYVYEIHDLWPETLVSTGMIREGRITKVIAKVCHWLHRGASAIVVTSPGMKKHLEKQGISAERIAVIPQWADEDVFRPTEPDRAFADEYGLSNKRNFVFAGNLGVAQGLDTLLDAAKMLVDLSDFQLVLIGDGVEGPRLRERCQAERIENVRLLGQMPGNDVAKVMASAEAAIVHLVRDPLFAITIPSKTQAYLACGVPVLCGVEGDAEEIICEARAGLSFIPEDAMDMARQVRALMTMSADEQAKLAANSLAAFRRRFQRSAIVDQYAELFRSIVTEPRTESSVELAAERKAA